MGTGCRDFEPSLDLLLTSDIGEVNTCPEFWRVEHCLRREWVERGIAAEVVDEVGQRPHWVHIDAVDE